MYKPQERGQRVDKKGKRERKEMEGGNHGVRVGGRGGGGCSGNGERKNIED